MSRGILHGIRVLDLGRHGAARHCAMMLAAHGAEVIRIEHPSSPAPDGADLDRNKKSVTLDLASESGAAALRALAATADVLAEDYAPGTMARLGLGHDTLAMLNPGLVFAAFPGPEGAHDTATAPMMAFGIMAALRQAAANGQGQIVDLAADTASPLRFSATPPPPTAAPPMPGADTDLYLAELPPAPISEADKRALRSAFGAFATGVTVVTTLQPDGTPRGFTANSFTSVSLDPPLLLICIAKSAHSFQTFLDAPHFAVNVLSEDQKPVSGLFASKAADKFDQTEWHPGSAGMPLLSGSLASIECARERVVNAGDHVLLLGRVIDHATTDANPLGYFKGNYFSIGLEDELVSAAAQSGAVQIGALLARGRQVLLATGQGGQISVPKSPARKPSPQALMLHLDKLGLKARLDFLYAVYQDSSTGQHGIYYHGTAVGLAPPGHKFFELDEIPFNKVQSVAERSMLARYCEEFRHGSFGIYQGDEYRGTVHRVSALEPSKH